MLPVAEFVNHIAPISGREQFWIPVLALRPFPQPGAGPWKRRLNCRLTEFLLMFHPSTLTAAARQAPEIVLLEEAWYNQSFNNFVNLGEVHRNGTVIEPWTVHRCETRRMAHSEPHSIQERIKDIECWLTDMDGVLVHENQPVPGARELIERWVDTSRRFLVLTNNSIYTPRDLQARLRASGLDIPEENIWTSAMATAKFLKSQIPAERRPGRIFVIGEAGLTTALHEAGFILTDQEPDYVVLGETRTYSFEAITRAIRLIGEGARFIATNPDATGPSKEGPLPATGAIAALITKATNREPYIVGKPNPMMFRSAMNQIEAHSETTAMIGDRMDTDIIAGMEAGLHTVLVLSGITQAHDINSYPFRPDQTLDSVADLVPLL